MQRVDSDSELFTDGNPATGVVGTRVKAAWLNAVQEEIANVVENAGLTLDADDDEQLLEVALRRWEEWKKEPNAVAYVGASSFTVATNRTAIYVETRAVNLNQTTDAKGYVSSSSYSSGTGLTTVNVTGVTVDAGLSAVTIGQEPDNAPNRGLFVEHGGQLANNGTDADHDIDIAAFARMDSGFAAWIVRDSAITKQIDAAWAAGTNAGGLDTGSVTTAEWYHLWAIKNPTSGVVDVLFSLSATAPTMPSGYTLKRRLGAVLTDGSANIVAFVQTGDVVLLKDLPGNNDTALGDTSAHLIAVSVPDGVTVEARLRIGNAIGATQVLVSSPFVNDEAPAVTTPPFCNTYGGHIAEVEVLTATGEVRARCTSAESIVYIGTIGWRDFDARPV